MTLLDFLKKLKTEEKLSSITAAIDFLLKKSGGYKDWTQETLRKVAYKHQKPSLPLAADIVYWSCGEVRVEELRPDLLPTLKKLGGERK